jgi:hypothetical protein
MDAQLAPRTDPLHASAPQTAASWPLGNALQEEKKTRVSSKGSTVTSCKEPFVT